MTATADDGDMHHLGQVKPHGDTTTHVTKRAREKMRESAFRTRTDELLYFLQIRLFINHLPREGSGGDEEESGGKLLLT